MWNPGPNWPQIYSVNTEESPTAKNCSRGVNGGFVGEYFELEIKTDDCACMDIFININTKL